MTGRADRRQRGLEGREMKGRSNGFGLLQRISKKTGNKMTGDLVSSIAFP
jgi:hypothetical protein